MSLPKGYTVSPLASLVALRLDGEVIVAVPDLEPARERLVVAAGWHARARAAARAAREAYPDERKMRRASKLADDADRQWRAVLRELNELHRKRRAS